MSLSHTSIAVSFLLACCCLLGTLGSVQAAPKSKLRVLLVTGGHSYAREPFLDVFRSNAELALTHVEHSAQTADGWERADTSQCDVAVLYDMPRDITEAQKALFLALFARGTGVVALHHALVSFQRWPEYERIVGGRWFDVPEKGGDPRETPSGYQHDVDQKVHVLSHPVTQGLADFEIHDEIYWGYRVGKDVTPLLTTNHPRSGNPIAWARTEQQSRVVYLQLGHGPSAFAHPSYRRLVGNAIRFAARR